MHIDDNRHCTKRQPDTPKHLIFLDPHAHLDIDAHPDARIENPRVGGSIPPLATKIHECHQALAESPA